LTPRLNQRRAGARAAQSVILTFPVVDEASSCDRLPLLSLALHLHRRVHSALSSPLPPPGTPPLHVLVAAQPRAWPSRYVLHKPCKTHSLARGCARVPLVVLTALEELPKLSPTAVQFRTVYPSAGPNPGSQSALPSVAPDNAG
jgi:hypothetical protein